MVKHVPLIRQSWWVTLVQNLDNFVGLSVVSLWYVTSRINRTLIRKSLRFRLSVCWTKLWGAPPLALGEPRRWNDKRVRNRRLGTRVVYPIKYAKHLCCALFCCGYISSSQWIHETHLPIVFRFTSLSLEQSCPFRLLTWFIWDYGLYMLVSWWRHQMEAFPALLAICAGNSPVPGEFPTQRPVTRSFDVFFDMRLNKRLSKQSWGWWFKTLSCPLWRHRNDLFSFYGI